MDIDEFKEKIKSWEDLRLSKSYLSLRKKLEEPKNKNLVEVLENRIQAIRNEWEARKDIEGEFIFAPSEGLLSVMGYKVGINGLKQELRRKILADVIEGPVPLVSSPGYMQEWGDDGSKKRINKTFNCLLAFSSGTIHQTHHEALKDWEEDLEWLSSHFKR